MPKAIKSLLSIVVAVALALSNVSFAAARKGRAETLYADRSYRFFAVCRGDSGNEAQSKKVFEERLKFLEERFSGCEIVEGSLIVALGPNRPPNVTSDFAFLANVTEITGYLLINFANGIDVPLPSLKVVRGQETRLVSSGLRGFPKATGHRFSVSLGESDITKWPFPSLQEIVNGKVLLYKLSNLTTPNATDWSDILPGGRDDVFDFQVGTALSVIGN